VFVSVEFLKDKGKRRKDKPSVQIGYTQGRGYVPALRAAPLVPTVPGVA
jgi:hypothetical protein